MASEKDGAVSAIKGATPRPWAIAWSGNPPLIVDAWGDGDILAQVSSGETFGADHERDAANAALIVRAVNSHEALVRALKALADAADDAFANEAFEGTSDAAPMAVAVTEARAALKLAGGA